ncbi:MAG TPA: glycoside hydrolase family 9 protein [Anaerolineales bacterium]|nr:glycoside hydrolase family 9 protein [Anaerolineales bacterium]
MSKKLLNTIAAITLLVFILAGSVYILFQKNQGIEAGALIGPPEIPGEVIYVPFPVDIQLDGDLSDWQNLRVYEVVDEDARDPAENGSFSFAVAADRQNLYITMQMPDKTIIAGEHRTEYWNEDSFEFYINASGNLETMRYAEKIFQININATDIGNTNPDELTITGSFSTGQVVRGYVFETEDGWGFEAAVPLADLVTPAHGTEIGFQAQINGAFTYDRNVKLIWSNADKTDSSWENPSLFGRAVFYEVGRTDVPPSSYVPREPTAVPTFEPVVIPDLVSVNQIGYFTHGPKIAVLALDQDEPVSWQLIDNSGAVVLDGETIFVGKDLDTRDTVHRIDFSDFAVSGSGYVLAAGGLESEPFDISEDIYSSLRYDALAYFYHNRSGIEIEAEYVGEDYARPAGHLTDNDVTCFQGMDADGRSWPGCEYSLDVSGGWYDAGDFGKYVVNGGISVWTLMNLYERFPEAYPDGSLSIPENQNGVADILDEARWEMEFILGMQVPEGEPLAGMAHHKMHDRVWEPMPMVPPGEVDNDSTNASDSSGRYLYPPSTTATFNLAATAGQCARIWAEIDPEFADRCLAAAEMAWEAGQANSDLHAGNTPGDGGGNYGDTVVADEGYWAAAELFITTGDQKYLDYLMNTSLFGKADQFDWGHTAPLGTVSLALLENTLPAEMEEQVQASIIAYADQLAGLQNDTGYLVPLDGDYVWGSNGLILNNMILLSIAHDLTGDSRYLDAVQMGMDYILGRNALNQSFVTGYGAYPFQHPHHRFWANDPGRGYPAPPPGAVSGGPNADPTDPDAIDAGLLDKAPARRYVDAIGSYSTNEITINWNAPLVWVATYLDEIAGE